MWSRRKRRFGRARCESSGDVGDIARLVQAAAGVRDIPDLRSRIAHELADCLWCVLTLADELEVDIERAFGDTMTQLEAQVRAGLADV